MRLSCPVCALSLLMASGVACAQGSVPETEKQMRAEWSKRCASHWDAETHMTKKEWDRVCRRVTDERVKFRMKHLKKHSAD
jgi:hypothetical protein